MSRPPQNTLVLLLALLMLLLPLQVARAQGCPPAGEVTAVMAGQPAAHQAGCHCCDGADCMGAERCHHGAHCPGVALASPGQFTALPLGDGRQGPLPADAFARSLLILSIYRPPWS